VGWLNQLNKIIPLPAALFLGNSLPIREWNLVHQNSVRPCFANRGANGIDGLWSTYYGLSTHFTESWLILGDLSALYDLSAPWIVAQLPANQRRRIVVINNQGGQIFERIQSLNHLPHQTKKVIINSHQHSFKNIAAHWNLQYLQPSNITELHHLPETDVLIEIQPQAQQSKLFWQNHQTLAN
jgi:2-succinyl-5-enolpyruvyl-6-hydroxy-3-cyclohexene-1-carboxylate synthase